MKKLCDMSTDELRTLLQRVTEEEDFYASRERLLELLQDPDSAHYDEHTVNRAAFHVEPGALLRPIDGVPIPESPLATEFREFFSGYTEIGCWLDDYKEDPLEGLAPHTPLAKKLARHRDYILAMRKTTRADRRFKRMGVYMADNPMRSEKAASALQETRIAELPPETFRALVRQLVMQEIFEVREKVVALLAGHPPREQLDLAFREFFVAYELFELVLEAYHYDADDGFELNPEVEAEIDAEDAAVKAGTAKLIPFKEIAKEFGYPLKCTR